nr:ABC transporter permease subunit [Angustibacter aerolatus]
MALSPVVVQVFDDRLGIQGNSARIAFLIIVFGVFGWPYLARIVRGQVLSLREREFVEAAVSMGAGTPRILTKEILPNLWVPILVYSSLLLPSLHLRRGGAVVPRRRRGGAHGDLGQDARRLGDHAERRPAVPVHPGYRALHRRPLVQPAGRLRPRRAGPAGGARLTGGAQRPRTHHHTQTPRPDAGSDPRSAGGRTDRAHRRPALDQEETT